MTGKLTTHVLDTANGCPAQGMQIELWTIVDGQPKMLRNVWTNADGRTEQPLLNGEELQVGIYELVFYVGEYFSKKAPGQSRTPFLEQVPVRFGVADANAGYHVPLLVSPWSYSTYRGS